MTSHKKLTIKNACNSHLHIIDPAFPNDGHAEAQKGTVQQYLTLAAELGLERAVFVQAKPFGTDNTCLLDAIEKYGPDRCRGIAVVKNDETSDSELKRLNDSGIRGLRFSVWNPKNAVVTFEDCAPLAARCADMGWNMQLHMSSAQLAERAKAIAGLPGKVVIDHMGRMNPELGVNDPAFPQLLKLIDKGNIWVKLSGSYLNTRTVAPWDDAAEVARALAKYAPERMLWGGDWPHVTEKVKPDEWALLNTIEQWFEDDKAKRLALVDNPCEVYGFQKTV